MLSVEIVRMMLEYNYSYQWLVWDSIMTLSDEQFLKEIPYSHGSIRNHMVHLATVDGGWLRGLKGDPNARTFRYKSEDYTTREAVRKICEQSAKEVQEYAASLTEENLKITPPNMPLTVWQTLLHLANHGTDHRAQVLHALHEFGAPTFDQDFVYHLMK